MSHWGLKLAVASIYMAEVGKHDSRLCVCFCRKSVFPPYADPLQMMFQVVYDNNCAQGGWEDLATNIQ